MTTTLIPDQDWIMERIHELDPKAHPKFRIYIGDYYMSTNVEIGGDGILRSSYGDGPTPEAAITATWLLWSELPRGQVLVTGAFTDHRAHHRWNPHENRWHSEKRS